MAGDPMMQMHVLLSDRVAYYRTFVLDIRFWTQLNLYLLTWCTVETALYFGDKGAPNFSNHAMNWLLFMWKKLFRGLIAAKLPGRCKRARLCQQLGYGTHTHTVSFIQSYHVTIMFLLIVRTFMIVYSHSDTNHDRHYVGPRGCRSVPLCQSKAQ